MTVKKGLKTLASNTPDFNNNAVSNIIADTNIGYAILSYTLAKTIRTNTVLTTSQKNDVKSSVNSKPYLNLGQMFDDLDLHTDKILTGELGEETVAGSNDRGTFLEHMQEVDSLENLIPSLYDQTADSIGKGVDDHFGTLRLSIRANMNSIKDGLTYINNASLATDTAYRSSMTNLVNFLNSVKDDSTDFQQTLNTFASAVTTAQTNLDSTLNSEPYLTFKTSITTNRDTINDQITKEVNNLGSIRTYSKNLVEYQSYVSLATSTKLNDLIVQSSANTAWQDYFKNYVERQSQTDPIYAFSTDSSNDTIVQQQLRLRGLPDVTDFEDIKSVAEKSKRDVRIATKMATEGKTDEEVITLACNTLNIDIFGKDSYAQSKALLDNMNENDINIIKSELALSQSLDILD